MTIKEKIENIAATHFPKCGFVCDNLYRVDELTNTAAMPVIIVTIPESGTVTIRNNRFHDNERVLLGFFDLAPHDANGDDNSEIYNRMKTLGFAFIKKMNESRQFEYITNITYSVFTVRMANIMTGVFFDIEVQDLGRCD